MATSGRSGCPVNLSLELIGDRWSLLVLRDIAFAGRRHFRELQAGSEEGIASNVLADRLQRLVDAGILVKGEDDSHRQKVLYSLTEAGVQLVPVIVALSGWGSRWLDADPRLAESDRLVGPPADACERLMSELRSVHGVPVP